MPKGIHTRQMPYAHLALIWTDAIRAFGVDLGERLNGVHTVDFLIWIPDYFQDPSIST